MRALCWWVDRWRKSTAYTDMTLEEQGAYRNLLDEATLRDGALPNVERVLARACGDPTAWKRVRRAVLARFTLEADGWHNETLDGVLHKTREVSERRSRAGQRGNATRWGVANAIANRIANPLTKEVANEVANGNANAVATPIAPDPDPDLKNKYKRGPC